MSRRREQSEQERLIAQFIAGVAGCSHEEAAEVLSGHSRDPQVNRAVHGAGRILSEPQAA